MNKTNSITKAKALKEKLSKSLPKGVSLVEAANVLSSFAEITKHQADIKKTEAEIKTLQVKENLLVIEMEKKYELYHKVFNTIFSERSASINKSFEIIDKGLKEGDKDLISIGLDSLSTVVASSPFANLSELSNLLESGNSIEL
jgi:hypothetical protein